VNGQRFPGSQIRHTGLTPASRLWLWQKTTSSMVLPVVRQTNETHDEITELVEGGPPNSFNHRMAIGVSEVCPASFQRTIIVR
jgi:hypothetical protein